MTQLNNSIKKSFLPLFLISIFAEAALHPAHKDKNVKFTVTGGFTIDEKKLEEEIPGLSVNRYGTTSVLKKDLKPHVDPITGDEFVVRDQHYSLLKYEGNPISDWNAQRVELGYGLRPIPAASGFYKTLEEAPKYKTGSNGKAIEVKGSSYIDKYLRETVYGYTGEDAKNGPIFVQIAYVHPELHSGEAFGLAGENLKTEMGFTHKGAYLGNGRTINSPTGYHGDTWWDSEEQTNYPALVSAVDFKGFVKEQNGKEVFDVKSFNKSAIFTGILLNETKWDSGDGEGGPTFPRVDYKFDTVYSISVETVLDFYARWLKSDDSLGEGLYDLYCAEHITDILNTTVSIIQSEKGYIDVYGDEGSELWKLALKKVYDKPLRNQESGPFMRDTYLGSKAEFVAFSKTLDKAGYKTLWQLYEAKNRKHYKLPLMKKNKEGEEQKYVVSPGNEDLKVPGYALAWTPETVADLGKDYIREYLPWYMLGSIDSVTAILGFSQEAQKRMAIDAKTYVKQITPLIQNIFLYEAALDYARASLEGKDAESIKAQFEKNRATRTQVLTGTIQALAGQLSSPRRLHRGDDESEVAAAAVSAAEITKASSGFTKLITGPAGWNATKKLADEILESAPASEKAMNGIDREAALRGRLFAQYQKATQETLDKLNAIEANTSTGQFTVKWYYAPAVHVRVGMGTHDAANREFFRVHHVANVMQAYETKPAVELSGRKATVETITDDPQTIVTYDVLATSAQPTADADTRIRRSARGRRGGGE